MCGGGGGGLKGNRSGRRTGREDEAGGKRLGQCLPELVGRGRVSCWDADSRAGSSDSAGERKCRGWETQDVFLTFLAVA